jgi:hypothetical protein
MMAQSSAANLAGVVPFKGALNPISCPPALHASSVVNVPEVAKDWQYSYRLLASKGDATIARPAT